MAGKKRKHGGGAASARLKTIKKKRKQQEQHNDESGDEDHSHTVAQTSQMPQETQNMNAATSASASDDILTPELRAELGGVDGDVLVVVGRKAPRVKAEVVPEELVQQAARMSKTKRRKLDQLAVRVTIRSNVTNTVGSRMRPVLVRSG